MSDTYTKPKDIGEAIARIVDDVADGGVGEGRIVITLTCGKELSFGINCGENIIEDEVYVAAPGVLGIATWDDTYHWIVESEIAHVWYERGKGARS